MTHPRPLAFSYLRFSRPEQRAGDSIRRQLKGPQDYCAEHGLLLDDSLRDEGVSAFRGKHRSETAALGAFLKRVENGEIPSGSFLLVESLDRLSREEVVVALELFLGLLNKGIRIVTLMDRRTFSRESIRDDYTQLLTSLVVMSRAYEESAVKSKRVAEAWAGKRARARIDKQAMTARVPGWIRLVGDARTGRYELIPERAEIVRRIIDWTIAGFGRRTIQKRLNEAGTPTWGTGRSRADYWHDSYVQKIVNSVAVFGRYAPQARAGVAPTEPIDGYFPAAVDEDTYWRAVAASKLRGSGRGTPGRRKNILSGLVRCEACGSNMVLLWKDRAKLRCGRAHASRGCTHRDLYDYGRIEFAVLLLTRLESETLTREAEALLGSTDVRLDALREQRSSAERQLGNLLDVAAEAGPAPTLATRIAALELEVQRIRALEAQASEERLRNAGTKAEVRDAAHAIVDLHGRLKTLAGDEQTLARARISQKLKLLVDHIDVGPAHMSLTHRGGGVSRLDALGSGASPALLQGRHHA